jgi:hypothetical protein
MSVPTLIRPPAAEQDTVHRPWCVEHWAEDNVCWARDVDVRVDPDADENRGRITAMLTHNPEPDPRCGGRILNLSLFIDQSGRCDGGIDMCPDEAEVAAHAMLAMVALTRGRNGEATWHRQMAEEAGAVLLGRRTGGVR